MRCSRQWRNIKHRIRAGLAHNLNCERHPGDLALFCVACPQENVNLPLVPERDCNHPCVSKVKLTSCHNFIDRELYIRTVAHDGNFKIDNLTMRNPADDVFLSDGEAMFVGWQKFQEYLDQVAKLPKSKKVSSEIYYSIKMNIMQCFCIACSNSYCFTLSYIILH
jgi:hypothetical protein